MAQTQKIYLGSHLIGDVRYGSHKIITRYADEGARVIDSSTILFLDSTDSNSYGGSGNTWYDLSPSGNNVVGDAITNYWNSANSTFQFPGSSTTDDTASATANSSFDIFDGDFTIQFVQTIDDANSGAQLNLTAPFGLSYFNSNPGWGMLINRDSGDANYKKLFFYLNNSVVVSTSTIFTNLQDFFVIQIVRSGSDITIYSDLTSVGTGTSSANANNNLDLIVGKAGATAYPTDGKLANLALYDRALDSAERQKNYDYFASQLGF
jgi:hypothetical protein